MGVIDTLEAVLAANLAFTTLVASVKLAYLVYQDVIAETVVSKTRVLEVLDIVAPPPTIHRHLKDPANSSREEVPD